MVKSFLVASLVFPVTVLLAPYAVYADIVTLYIPEASPVAISADVLGTDGAGRTTWRISPGQPSGTLPVVDFPAATIVEGPNDFHAVEEVDGITGIEDCTIKDGVAVCTGVLSASGTAVAAVATETVAEHAFAVQVTGIPKNGAGSVVGSSLGVAAAFMGVVYCLAF
ncbi:hypothetical protein L226DRAFT_611376 [Lentinus tigrinus ALCF2SS1-7]|uniref:Uncharacterized protein n=1 Tax=Lentinus tigrinus ALCF2SS1-6 TaxID=1328759 RepID=A0A5C2SAR3_9APHY|nr:hypothetical protein L227DRAFT_653093 [Lentinus tigrinus ALCF2SS1-6]RPD76989.1 hypothetical protein L226DRAFT_611376 [Lentinus tigrinus ALCF2SS1-7]